MRTRMHQRSRQRRQRLASQTGWWVALAIVVVAGGIVGVALYRHATRPTAAASAAIGDFQRAGVPAVTPGKPVPVLFVSALYCPFCGAERWALVEALGRFGTWTNLQPAHSTAGIDGLAAVPTYDFLHAAYHSPYVAFSSRDVADATGGPLQTLSGAEQQLLNADDPDGGIPFLVIDGAYFQVSSGYSPGLIAAKSFAQVHGDLGTNAAGAQAIQHEADVLTALICHADGGQPGDVCQAAAVQALAATLR